MIIAVTQQEQTMEKEATASAQIYKKDSERMKSFMERKKINNMRDAIRICIEFTDAHGGLL